MNRGAVYLFGSLFFLCRLVHADGPVLADTRVPGQVFRECEQCPEMVVIPEGSFRAQKATQVQDHRSEQPASIRSFAIGKTEVTQGQWKAVMGSNPSKFSSCGDECPVEQVSWNNVQEFLRRLSQKAGRTYRLPSDAEWEYACHAGNANPYCGSEKIANVAWYDSNSDKTTHPVARKQANAWGLYDMTGNVWEWTLDCSLPDDKKNHGDSGGSTSGDCKRHALRGGSWGSIQQFANSASRGNYPSKSRAYDVVSRRSDFGLRVAATLP